jgi:hydrogenase maturation factor
MEVKDEATGKTVQWELETGNVTTLQRRGWRRDTLKPGDAIIVTGFRAKDGANLAAASTVSTAEGKRLFAGSANDGSPTQ